MHGWHRPLSAVGAASDWKWGLAFALVTASTVHDVGGAAPGLKVVLGHMDPLTVTWYRFSISAIQLRSPGTAGRSGRAARHAPIAGAAAGRSRRCSGLLGNYVLFAWGLDRLNPGAAQILVQVAPLLLLLASIFFWANAWMPCSGYGVASIQHRPAVVPSPAIEQRRDHR
ncbi:MAG: EamA family transporter [Halioglobus sp.]|nr:EamA family transporter [Halioglobus sp.]